MITLIRTSDLSLPYSVRSYIDSCAYEYTEQDAWSKIGSSDKVRGIPTQIYQRYMIDFP